MGVHRVWAALQQRPHGLLTDDLQGCPDQIWPALVLALSAIHLFNTGSFGSPTLFDCF